jgi:hypothetical protein
MGVLEIFADITQWSGLNGEAARARAIAALEGGKILYFPALAGQYVLEQTFHLSLDSLAQPTTSPLHILERLTGRTLIA